jgi:hypothetical protein
MVFNATNNNVLVISWRQVLLVEETWDLFCVWKKTVVAIYIFY